MAGWVDAVGMRPGDSAFHAEETTGEVLGPPAQTHSLLSPSVG